MASGFAEVAGIYRRLIGARIRADWQYRVSFVLFVIGQVLATALDLLAITVIFSRVPVLDGWTLDEVLLLYGISAVGFGIGDVFVGPVERAGWHIKQGTFDRFLLRPVGPLLQLCSDEFALRRAGKLFQPVVILCIAVARLGIDWGPAQVAVLMVAIAAGTVIFSALWLLTSSFAFWMVETQEIANSFTYGGGFISQYPLDVLSPWLRRFLVLVPLAFVSYVPATWLLGKPDATGLPAAAPFASPLVATALAAAAAVVWRSGIRHYRSTGS